MTAATSPLRVDAPTARTLLERLGPSLGLWRAAEVAALREVGWAHPVLDLGCGDGMVTSLVLAEVALGVDPEAEALERARATGVYQRLQAMRVEELPDPPGSFAMVLSNSVLEHVVDLDRALAAAARLLVPGGRLVLTTPTEAFADWLALPSERYAAWRNRQLAHVNLWPAERWAVHLARVGLELVRVRPYLRRWLVSAWDALDVAQQLRVSGERVAGRLWRGLRPDTLDSLARRLAGLDLAAPPPGGGRLIEAVKVPPRGMA